MNQFTQIYVETFNKAASRIPSKEINSQGGLGMAADLLPPVRAFGYTRAGRATAMASASGQRDISNLVRYPATTDMGLMTGGAAAGGVVGGLLTKDPADRGLGVAIGATAGGLLASVTAGILRRRKIKQIEERYDQAESLDPEAAIPDSYSTAKSVLLPYSGYHRLGQAEAARWIRQGGREGTAPSRMPNAVESVMGRVPLLGAAVAPLAGIYSNLEASSIAAAPRARWEKKELPQ